MNSTTRENFHRSTKQFKHMRYPFLSLWIENIDPDAARPISDDIISTPPCGPRARPLSRRAAGGRAAVSSMNLYSTSTMAADRLGAARRGPESEWIKSVPSPLQETLILEGNLEVPGTTRGGESGGQPAETVQRYFSRGKRGTTRYIDSYYAISSPNYL